MMRLFSVLTLCLMNVAYAQDLQRIDIVSYTPDLLPHPIRPYKYALLQENFEVNFSTDLYKYVNEFEKDSSKLGKIIFYDYCVDPKTELLPKNKMVCFKWEAIKIREEFYRFYSRVYTVDDDLIDNKKFFKFYYPVLLPMLSDVPSFNEKNLCTIIAANWDPPERRGILEFFSTKPKDSLHVYGFPPLKYSNTEMHKGFIPGFHSGQEKLNVLKQYKFCVCFENTHTTPGYITEKIFDAFAAGTVPIYWGPDNVEVYIPENCFIDYRKFKDNQDVYNYITTMSELEYEQYICNIRSFLESDQAYLFSQENFEAILLQAVLD